MKQILFQLIRFVLRWSLTLRLPGTLTATNCLIWSDLHFLQNWSYGIITTNKTNLFHLNKISTKSIFPTLNTSYAMFKIWRVQPLILLFLWYSHRTNQIFPYKKTKQILFYLIRFELKCLFPHSFFWPTISPWLSPNSHTQDINPLALPGRIESIIPPASHLSWSDPALIPTISPPFFQRRLPIG